MNKEQEMIVKKLWGKYPFLYNTSLGMYWMGNEVFVADDACNELFYEYIDFIERIKKDAGNDNLGQIYYRDIIIRHKEVLFNAFKELIEHGKSIQSDKKIKDDLENFIEGLTQADIDNIKSQIEHFGVISNWYIKYEVELKRKEQTK